MVLLCLSPRLLLLMLRSFSGSYLKSGCLGGRDRSTTDATRVLLVMLMEPVVGKWWLMVNGRWSIPRSSRRQLAVELLKKGARGAAGSFLPRRLDPPSSVRGPSCLVVHPTNAFIDVWDFGTAARILNLQDNTIANDTIVT